MSREYLILDSDRPYKQDAWTEEKDAKGRVTRPARPARDELDVHVRLDRQYRAVLRFPVSNVVPTKRQVAIKAALIQYGLGEEIAPGVQIVEVEYSFQPAQIAQVTVKQKDSQDNVVTAESFTPARPESISWAFTLRLDGQHLVKTSMSEAEMRGAGWRQRLAQKVQPPESFTE